MRNIHPKKNFDIETLKKEVIESKLTVQRGPVDQLEDRFACTEEASGSSFSFLWEAK